MARIRVSSLVLVALAAAPIAAQQPAKPDAAPAAAPATHTVVRGETLWGLAKQYLGDAYLWPEIYRLNSAVIEDPHWIYPGEVLTLPTGSAPASPGPLSSAGPYDPNASTIFDPRRFRRARRSDRQGANLLASHQAVRSGQYLAAPFVWTAGGPVGAGRVLSTAASQIVVPTLEQRVFQGEEAIFISLPTGAARVNGERFMTFALGPVLEGQGQVVLVTGIVELRRDPGVGDARAVIRQRFATIDAGQGVIPIDSLIPRIDQMPSYVEFGQATRLAWVVGTPVIAQMGSYVILSSGARDGLVTGDQVTLHAGLGTGVAGETRAPEAAALVQVLRVTPFGASAIILNRSQADIGVGMPGRITAKMP